MSHDPDANYEPNVKFILEIDDIALTSFEKVTIGDSTWGIIEGRAGTDPLTKITSSGLKSVQVITLEKQMRDGAAQDLNELIVWHTAGSKDRRSGAIAILNRDDEELMRFNFKLGWVSKFTPPELDANQDNTAMVFKFEISIGEVTLG